MPSTRRAPRKKPEERREEIVEATLALLAEGGAAAASTPAIARRVGITQSALFKHFSNKEAIWRGVMERIADEIGARLHAASLSEGGHAERLCAIIRAYLGAVLDLPAIPALLFSEEVQQQSAEPYLRREIARRFGWFQEALTVQLQAGRVAGEFRPDLDIPAAATLAAGIAQSLILRWKVSDAGVDMLAEAERVFPLYLLACQAGRG